MSTPYGAWPSPIDPADVAAGGREFAAVEVADGVVYWLERRPSEGGRGVVCRAPLADGDDPDSHDAVDAEELTPESFDVRTLVHQYGGGDIAVVGGALVVSGLDDGRLYRLPADGSGEPTPITPEPPAELGHRYADLTAGPDGRGVYAVRERHVGPGTDDEPINELVRIAVSPRTDERSGADDLPEPTVVAEGHDFYAAPRPSPDADRLAYLRWDHPKMPWDGTELVVADRDADGDLVEGTARVVAGGPSESVVSPKWSPNGTLHAVSDRTGWWNLYRVDGSAGAGGADATLINLHPAEAEFGVPMWVLGISTYAFLDDGRIATLFAPDGDPDLRLLDPDTGKLTDPGLPYTSFRPASIRSTGDRVAFVGHRPDAPTAVVDWAPADSAGAGDDAGASPATRRIRESTDDPLDPAYVSTPESVTFPTGDAAGADDAVAHAHYYPPHNPDVEAPEPDAERPPLVVSVHGGPTSRSEVSLSASTQFFTTRGIGVLDVNYRGSTGYGRAYRSALDGQWGVRDVLDCVNGAEYAAEAGLADPDRLAIRGGSAGGYAVLSALAFHDAFDVGASYYGVADLRALAEETHKFESRYLDGLLGPLPAAADVYRERSPVFHAEGITAPLLLLQGGNDEVVPPEQAEAMIDALVDNETPYAYVEFPEERHGFRDADNVARAHAAELATYGAVFGFDPAGDAEGIDLLTGEYPPELS